MKKILLILFVLVPAVIASSIFIMPDRATSEQENRSLMTRDGISRKIRDGSFQEDLESYLSDQFPLREELVYLQTWLRFAVGQRDIGGAYICKSGRLIQKTTDADIDVKALKAYALKVNAAAEERKTYVMYVPSAGVELKSELPKGAVMYDYDSLYAGLTKRLPAATALDLRGVIASPDCYYKTDHHWNYNGAYLAYTEFCKARGVQAKPLESFGVKTVSGDFRGTLYSKVPTFKGVDEIGLPSVPELSVTADGKTIDFYDYKALETKDKYNVFQGGNHGVVEIENKNGNGKTLLVLKDSFANSFVPYIAGEYSKIVMLDERYAFVSLNEFAKQLNPDEILVLREIIN